MQKSTTRHTGDQIPQIQQFRKAKAIAEQTGLSPKTIHRWAASGFITRRKVSQRLVLFDVAEVMKHIEGGAV